MGIMCGPPPGIRPPTRPPRPQGRWKQEGILKTIACSEEDIFVPNKRDNEMMEENRLLLERITELEAENLELKDKLLQAEFGGDEPPQPPEPPPGPMCELVWE